VWDRCPHVRRLREEGKSITRRLLDMVGRAEFKRRQAASIFKVTPRAFGTGRRIPIARCFHET